MFVRHTRSVTDIKYPLTFKQGYNDCQSIHALCWTPYKDLNGFYFMVCLGLQVLIIHSTLGKLISIHHRRTKQRSLS